LHNRREAVTHPCAEARSARRGRRPGAPQKGLAERWRLCWAGVNFHGCCCAPS